MRGCLSYLSPSGGCKGPHQWRLRLHAHDLGQPLTHARVMSRRARSAVTNSCTHAEEGTARWKRRGNSKAKSGTTRLWSEDGQPRSERAVFLLDVWDEGRGGTRRQCPLVPAEYMVWRTKLRFWNSIILNNHVTVIICHLNTCNYRTQIDGSKEESGEIGVCFYGFPLGKTFPPFCPGKWRLLHFPLLLSEDAGTHIEWFIL